MVKKEQVREILLWGMMGLSGVGAVGANVGGAASAERIAKIEATMEATRTLEGARLDRIEAKIDRLVERAK